jgi:hypothetical protein
MSLGDQMFFSKNELCIYHRHDSKANAAQHTIILILTLKLINPRTSMFPIVPSAQSATGYR